MEPHETLAWFEKNREVLTEAYHIHSTYVGYHRKPDGTTTKVTVTVYDAGPARSGYRYHVDAIADDGARTMGNPAASIEAALGLVHWGDLDK
jgi:hypothetical protein